MPGTKIKILLFFIGFVLFMSNYLFLIAAGFDRTFLDYDFYEEFVNEAEVGEELLGMFTGDIIDNIEQEEKISEKMLEQEMDERLALVVEDTFDADWIEGVLLDTINSTLLWIKGSEDELELVIELGDKREELMDNMVSEMEKDGITIPENLSEEFASGGDFADDIPNEINMGELLGVDELKSNLGFVQTLYSVFVFVPVVLFIFFIIIFVLISGWSEGLKWFSAVLFISSICSALTFVLLGLLAPYVPLGDTLFSIFIGRALMLPLVFMSMSFVVFIVIKIFEKRAPSPGTNQG